MSFTLESNETLQTQFFARSFVSGCTSLANLHFCIHFVCSLLCGKGIDDYTCLHFYISELWITGSALAFDLIDCSR